MNTRNWSDVGSNFIVNVAASSTRNTLQRIDHAGLDQRTESNPENIVSSCVEFTTGIFNSDLTSLWAKIRTQSHSQQSSVVGAEPRASMAAKFTAGESYELTSQELAYALKVIRNHITETGKLMEKIEGY